MLLFQKLSLSSVQHKAVLQAFFYFPIKVVNQSRFFTNPKWTALRRYDIDKSAQDPCNYFGSAEAKRLNDGFNGKLMDPDAGCYELGFDYGQVFNIATHSVGIICLR